MTLAVMMTASPVWGAAHAADEAIGNQTENTVAERYADNDKSEDHSNKADDYTESLQTDNRSADIEYEAPVAEIAEETAPAEDVQTAEVIPAAVTPEKVKKAEPAPAKGTEAAATAEEVQIAEAATAETAPAAVDRLRTHREHEQSDDIYGQMDYPHGSYPADSGSRSDLRKEVRRRE